MNAAINECIGYGTTIISSLRVACALFFLHSYLTAQQEAKDGGEESYSPRSEASSTQQADKRQIGTQAPRYGEPVCSGRATRVQPTETIAGPQVVHQAGDGQECCWAEPVGASAGERAESRGAGGTGADPGAGVWPVSYTHLDVYKRQQ